MNKMSSVLLDHKTFLDDLFVQADSSIIAIFMEFIILWSSFLSSDNAQHKRGEIGLQPGKMVSEGLGFYGCLTGCAEAEMLVLKHETELKSWL